MTYIKTAYIVTAYMRDLSCLDAAPPGLSGVGARGMHSTGTESVAMAIDARHESTTTWYTLFPKRGLYSYGLC